MSDPGTQLRAYLDQTVERVDVDDVWARAVVRSQWKPHPLVDWRPAWIAAAAAFIMVISIGAFAAGAWLLATDLLADFATSPEHTPAAAVDWPGVLILGLGNGGGTITLLASGHAVSNLIHRMRDRRMTMQTVETSELELAHLREDNARLGSTKRSLLLTLIMVLVVVAGAATWLVVDNTGTATEGKNTALVDDYLAAWAANDGRAVLDLMTPDGRLLANHGRTLTGEDLASFVASVGSFDPVRVGDPIILEPSIQGLSPGWFVANHTNAPGSFSSGDWYELELFKIVERNGQFLIAYHETWRGGE